MIKAVDDLFVNEDGTQFIPVGFTTGLNSVSLNDEDMHKYFVNFTSHKGNVLRTMFGKPVNQNPSWPSIELAPGVINPSFAPWLNRLLSYCEPYKVKLLIAIWSWWTNYYGSQSSFFGQPSWDAQKKVIDYLATSWGDREEIFGWELYNEVSWDNTLTGIWTSAMSEYAQPRLKQLIGLSAGDWRMGTATSPIWSCPTLDYSASHAYNLWGNGLTFNLGLSNRLRVVTDIMTAVKGKTTKPFIDTEIPGIPTNFFTKLVCWNLSSNEAYAQSFLDVGRDYLAQGAASPGLTWPATPGSWINGVPCELTPLLLDMQAKLVS